jgi:serine/threonine protein kinase
VRSLLSQLAAVFNSLESIAFHRDVSSHNVLVDFPEGEQSLRPNFALIDFGLAVRSGSWIREWRNSNLAGDPRYWTPSAWMAFAFGFKYVATHPNPGFQQQYLARMDHFSLGVLVLETLFALWNTGEAYEGKHPGLLEVRAAWCKYWVAVIHLFQMFHRQGAQEVRQFLAQSQDEGVTCLCNHLRQLRQSLRAAAAHPLNSSCAALLRVLADLIDERGSVTWTEIPQMLGEDFAEIPAPASPAAGESNSRSSMALADLQLVAPQRVEHRRIRSTGGTLDQELRRFEPEISQVLFKTLQSQQAPQLSGSLSGPTTRNHSPDVLSRSFTHARPMSTLF